MPLDVSKYDRKSTNGKRSPTSSPKQGSQLGDSDRLSQTQTSAQEAAEQTRASLVNGHQERLVALSSALDKAEQRRTEVLEQLSDRVVYLQDGDLFVHDLLLLAQRKLKKSQTPDKEEVTGTAIDALVDAFDAIGEWQLPAISPNTVLGCLPM